MHAARRLKDLDSLFVVYCTLTLHAFGRLAAAAAAAAAARHFFRVLSKYVYVKLTLRHQLSCFAALYSSNGSSELADEFCS